MSGHSYSLTDEIVPTLGLIVLQVDETIESDFRRLFAPDQARLHVTRIPSGDELTPDTIGAMEGSLPKAAGLFPPAARFDAVGYGCTSGTALIGSDRVRELVQGACQAQAVTNPLTATLTAIRALGLNRIGIVSPYIASVATPLQDAFERAGVTIADTLSFGEQVEANVARIDPGSLEKAARILADRTALDGVFLSCTNLRTLGIIAGLEAELDLPVLSSNQTLGWHMARLASVDLATDAPGRLMTVCSDQSVPTVKT